MYNETQLALLHEMTDSKPLATHIIFQQWDQAKTLIRTVDINVLLKTHKDLKLPATETNLTWIHFLFARAPSEVLETFFDRVATEAPAIQQKFKDLLRYSVDDLPPVYGLPYFYVDQFPDKIESLMTRCRQLDETLKQEFLTDAFLYISHPGHKLETFWANSAFAKLIKEKPEFFELAIPGSRKGRGYRREAGITKKNWKINFNGKKYDHKTGQNEFVADLLVNIQGRVVEREILPYFAYLTFSVEKERFSILDNARWRDAISTQNGVERLNEIIFEKCNLSPENCFGFLESIDRLELLPRIEDFYRLPLRILTSTQKVDVMKKALCYLSQHHGDELMRQSAEKITLTDAEESDLVSGLKKIAGAGAIELPPLNLDLTRSYFKVEAFFKAVLRAEASFCDQGCHELGEQEYNTLKASPLSPYLRYQGSIETHPVSRMENAGMGDYDEVEVTYQIETAGSRLKRISAARNNPQRLRDILAKKQGLWIAPEERAFTALVVSLSKNNFPMVGKTFLTKKFTYAELSLVALAFQRGLSVYQMPENPSVVDLINRVQQASDEYWIDCVNVMLPMLPPVDQWIDRVNPQSLALLKERSPLFRGLFLSSSLPKEGISSAPIAGLPRVSAAPEQLPPYIPSAFFPGSPKEPETRLSSEQARILGEINRVVMERSETSEQKGQLENLVRELVECHKKSHLETAEEAPPAYEREPQTVPGEKEMTILLEINQAAKAMAASNTPENAARLENLIEQLSAAHHIPESGKNPYSRG